jgi:hypothetical protein
MLADVEVDCLVERTDPDAERRALPRPSATPSLSRSNASKSASVEKTRQHKMRGIGQVADSWSRGRDHSAKRGRSSATS